MITVTEDRIIVWELLSDIFLDTELTNDRFEYIVSTLKETPFSIQEIEDIMCFEIYPACIPNLRCIAGEWTGFNRAWLIENITPYIGKRSLWTKIFFRISIIQDDWQRVKEKLHNEGKT